MSAVSVFSVLVSLSLVFATVQPALARFLRNSADDGSTSQPELFELRSPERAVAEVSRGMLRV